MNVTSRMNDQIFQRMLYIQQYINRNQTWKTSKELSQMALCFVDTDNKIAQYLGNLRWRESATSIATKTFSNRIGDNFNQMNVFFDLQLLGIVYYITNGKIILLANIVGKRDENGQIILSDDCQNDATVYTIDGGLN